MIDLFPSRLEFTFIKDFANKTVFLPYFFPYVSRLAIEEIFLRKEYICLYSVNHIRIFVVWILISGINAVLHN